MQGYPLGKNVRIEIHKSGFTAMEQVQKTEDQIEQATVLEIGSECDKIEVGQKILFKAYNIDTIEINGEIYTLIPEEDIKYIFL